MISVDTYFSLKDFEHRALWVEKEPVWTPLLTLSEYLKSASFKIEIDLPKEVHLINPKQISIGEGTIIEPGAMIIGPCMIGKNCVIRHGAYIREEVILGDECHVGHSSELKHSILLKGAAATHFVYVGDSILGQSVNLGAGVKCANLRLDRNEVSISASGKKWRTGLKKFGAIVGDQTQIGCNSVLNPGTLIGKECFALPLTNLKGVIPFQSQIDNNGPRAIDQKILKKLLLWKSSALK